MLHDLTETIINSLQNLGLGGGVIVSLALLSWIGTLVALPLIIIALPRGYLAQNERLGKGKPGYTLWHVPYLVFKNLLGTIFILAGLAMLVLPGQGLLTLVMGLALLNFPGKRRLIRRIVTQRRIFAAINHLRIKAGKAPLEK
jgi:hypothetical protein